MSDDQVDLVTKVLLVFGGVILALIVTVVVAALLTQTLPIEAAMTVLGTLFTGILAGVGVAKFTTKSGGDGK